MRQEVNAEDVVVGQEIYFANSRRPQAVEVVKKDPDNGVVTLRAGDAMWLVPNNFQVEVEEKNDDD